MSDDVDQAAIDRGLDLLGVDEHGRYRPELNGDRPAGDVFELLTFDELLAQPDLSWLIDGMVPEGFAVIYGAPGTYKSFLALDWALCVATGHPWFGHDVDAGHVVYVAAEGRGGLKQRVLAWWHAHGQPDLSRARFLPEAVNLLDKQQVQRARRTLALLPEPARLLVVDTMARSLIGGDENAARDVGLFIAAVDGLRQARTALVVHHAGKDGQDRGSSALRGAADIMVKTSRDSEGPRATVECDKAKDFEAWDTLTVHREILEGSCVLSLVQDRDARDELRDRVYAYVAEHEPASGKAIEDGVGGKRDRVREQLRRLDANNRIRRHGNGWVTVRPEQRGEAGRDGREPTDDPRPTGGPLRSRDPGASGAASPQPQGRTTGRPNTKEHS